MQTSDTLISLFQTVHLDELRCVFRETILWKLASIHSRAFNFSSWTMSISHWIQYLRVWRKKHYRRTPSEQANSVINMQIKLAFETPILNCSTKKNVWIIVPTIVNLVFHSCTFFSFFSESKIIKDKSATISNTTPPPQKVCISNLRLMSGFVHCFNCILFLFWGLEFGTFSHYGYVFHAIFIWALISESFIKHICFV